MSEEIFYPNDLTKEEVEVLDGWKLKVATLHFGKTRRDCVRSGYGYSYRKEKFSDIRPDYNISENNEIILVADKDGECKAISLRNEIDWDDKSDLLHETGTSFENVLRNHIMDEIS